MAGECLLAGVRKELDDVRRLEKIIEKARDGRGHKSIWEMLVDMLAEHITTIKKINEANSRLIEGR